MSSQMSPARSSRKHSCSFYSVFILTQASLISTVVALVILIEDAQHAAVQERKMIWLVLSAALTFALSIGLATLWRRRRRDRKRREEAVDQRIRHLWANLPEGRIGAPPSDWSAGAESSMDVELSHSSREQWQGAIGEGTELRHFKSCQHGKMLATPIRSDSKYWQEIALAAINRTASRSFTPSLNRISSGQGQAPAAGLAITSDEQRRVSAASKDTVRSTGTVVVHSRLAPPRIDSEFWLALATPERDVAPPVPPKDDSTTIKSPEAERDSVMVEETSDTADDSLGKNPILSRRGLQPLLVVTSQTLPRKRPLKCLGDIRRSIEASVELQRRNGLTVDDEKGGSRSGASNQDYGWGTEESAPDTIVDGDTRGDDSISFEGVVPYEGT